MSRFFGTLCAVTMVVWTLGCESFASADADREVHATLAKYQDRVLAQRATWVKQPVTLPPESQPATSQPTSQAAATAPANARTLSLEEALETAFKNSRDFKTASESLYRSGLGYSLVRYTFGPILDSTISYLWNYNEAAPNTHTVGVPLSVRQILPLGGSVSGSAALNGVRTRAGDVSGDNDFRWGSDLQVNLEQPLLRGAGYEVSHEALTQAERGLVYAVRDFELFRQDFAIRITQTYYDLVSQRKRLANDEQNYKDALYDRQRAEALRKLERNKPDDVFQARRREIAAETSLVAARTEYRLRLDDFKILLGLPTTEAIDLTAQEPEFQAIRIEAESAVDVALHNRLDLHTERDRLEDAKRGVRIAKNDLLPDLNLAAGYGVASGGASAAAATRVSDATPNQRSGQAGVTLRLPLDKKAERNAYRSSQIDLEQARRGLDQREDEVSRDIRNAIRELSQFQKQIELQLEQIASERRAVAVMQFRVEAGEAQQRDLTEARQSLNDAQNLLIDLKVQHFVARLRLRRNLGILFIDKNGMWEP